VIILLILITALNSIPANFIPVGGFIDLDYTATPARFGLLLVAGNDPESNTQMAENIISNLDSLPPDAAIDLYIITPDQSGYREVASLCMDYGGPPSTLVLIGHCGYIELDPEYLAVEILDSWYTWGSSESRRTGICNFCNRCNP